MTAPTPTAAPAPHPLSELLTNPTGREYHSEIEIRVTGDNWALLVETVTKAGYECGYPARFGSPGSYGGDSYISTMGYIGRDPYIVWAARPGSWHDQHMTSAHPAEAGVR